MDIDTLMSLPTCPGSGDPLKCIVVPAYSFGYIKVPIEPYYPPKIAAGEAINDAIIYPNPTARYLSVQASCNEQECPTMDRLSIIVMNMFGQDCLVRDIENSHAIDISSLPSGVYQIFITFEDGTTIVKQLVKQ